MVRRPRRHRTQQCATNRGDPFCDAAICGEAEHDKKKRFTRTSPNKFLATSSRKLPTVPPASSASAPKFPNNYRFQPQHGRSWPELANTWHTTSQIGRFGPNVGRSAKIAPDSTSVGGAWPMFGQPRQSVGPKQRSGWRIADCWSTPTNIGQVLDQSANVDRIRAVFRPPEHLFETKSVEQLLSNCGPRRDRHG